MHQRPFNSCPKDKLPIIHSTPLVVEPGTDHRPRANRSNVDNMPACVNNRPKREPQKFLCMTPKDALEMFGDKLTDFEREEIKNFPQIYYLGLDAQKIKAVQGAPQNHGFDDKNGAYIKVLKDHIKYRYEVLEPIGQGSFGQVLKCLDHKTMEQVALKVLVNNPSYPEQVQRELNILELLRKKDRHNEFNVIHMKEHFVFRGHICITFELQGINLHEAITNNQQQGFRKTTVRQLSHAILRCLQLLHHEKIIHCDLKPENIVLTKRGNVKVIDFGCSCYENETEFNYIQTRYYRAPEVILRNSYGMGIDMWSLGCIIAELYTGRPIFPGENEKDQMALIMEVLGLPPEDLVRTACKRKKFFYASGKPRPYTDTKGIIRKPGSKDLASVLKSSDPIFLDFIKRCLEWDPKKRMTPDEAIVHDWFVEAQKRYRTRICTRRVDTPPQSATKAQGNKGQDNTSASKTQHIAGKSLNMRCSLAKHASRFPKLAAVKTAKPEATGVTATESLPKPGVQKLPRLHIPRPPNRPTERPVNPACKYRRPGLRRLITPPSAEAKTFLPRLN